MIETLAFTANFLTTLCRPGKMLYIGQLLIWIRSTATILSLAIMKSYADFILIFKDFTLKKSSRRTTLIGYNIWTRKNITKKILRTLRRNKSTFLPNNTCVTMNSVNREIEMATESQDRLDKNKHIKTENKIKYVGLGYSN